MGKFEETVVKAKDIFDDSTKKIGEVWGVQKLKLKLASTNSELSKAYETLGRMVHEAGADNVPEGAKETIEQIEALKAQIAELEEQIAVGQGKKLCKNCNTANPSTSDFCSKCGNKLDE